ncbi:MAG: class I tRNA ligase family protein, partial [Candidatus Omnitrophica bacterium]|nr:class I tRNA ligase family protein [Candidatus Omnitrophota bacterium]
LYTLVRVIAPILTFTADDFWQHIPKRKIDISVLSVHLLEWPEIKSGKGLPEVDNSEYDGLVKVVFNLIPDVAKVLEEKRGSGVIGSSFDAKIKLLTNNEERYKFLASLKGDLCEIFKVSQVEIEKQDKLDSVATKAANIPDIAILASKADGIKCARCWNYDITVGESKAHSLICKRCASVIGEE